MKTTHSNKIISKLQVSEADYEKRILASIITWAHIHGKYPSVIQQLLANRQVNRWYLKQLELVENQFLKSVECIPSSNVDMIHEQYLLSLKQINKHYPSFIEEFKRNKSFSDSIASHLVFYN